MIAISRSLHQDSARDENLKRYARTQCITSTVRISRKEGKPAPKVVFWYGSQERQIKKFLKTRRCVLESLKRGACDNESSLMKLGDIYSCAEIGKIDLVRARQRIRLLRQRTFFGPRP